MRGAKRGTHYVNHRRWHRPHLPEKLRSQSSPDGSSNPAFTGLKGRRPRPLDDGGPASAFSEADSAKMPSSVPDSTENSNCASAHAVVARASTSVYESWETKRRGMVDCVPPTSHTDTSQTAPRRPAHASSDPSRDQNCLSATRVLSRAGRTACQPTARWWRGRPRKGGLSRLLLAGGWLPFA